MVEKIIRSVCLFAEKCSEKELTLLNSVVQLLQNNQFLVQTKRVCLPNYHTTLDSARLANQGILVGFGSQSWQSFQKNLKHFIKTSNINLTLDLTEENISEQHIETLWTIIEKCPEKTFSFAFGFNLPPSSPFFPSATFGSQGFSVGLQATDLSEHCSTLDEWFALMKSTWDEIDALLSPIKGYLGIDSSIAPLFLGKASLLHFIRRLGLEFSHSVTTDIYTSISAFIKTKNPNPVGLCGLMFPCLEDFELAEEYEKGNFSIERNLFLSLHSGLGIDTYPIGIDQNRKSVRAVIRLVQQLSVKYQKPLAIRFVSDGKAKIGEYTSLGNKYLKDVIIKAL